MWSKEEQIALLLWLEKDTPHLYFCHRCIKLHIWVRVEPPYGRGLACYDQGCKKPNGRWSVSKAYEVLYGLDFHILQLVMNRHFYGEGHGPSLDVLSYTANRDQVTDRKSKVVVDQTWRARIINHELYLEASIQVYQRDGLERQFLEYLSTESDLTSCLVCDHIGLDPWASRRSVPAVQQHSRHEPFVPIADTLKSCRDCYTDYLFSVDWRRDDGSGPNGWVVSLTKWHRLGACRVPATPGPGAFEMSGCPSLVRNKKNAKPGKVYRKWISKDAKAWKRINKTTGQPFDASFQTGYEHCKKFPAEDSIDWHFNRVSRRRYFNIAPPHRVSGGKVSVEEESSDGVSDEESIDGVSVEEHGWLVAYL